MQTEVAIDNCPYCGGKCTIVNSIRSEAVCVYCPFVDCHYRGADKPTNLEAISAHNLLCRSVRENAVLREQVRVAKGCLHGILISGGYEAVIKSDIALHSIAQLEQQITNKATP